jgi:hypothetical protein
MVDPLRYNLFRFAPKELSHSAFWAWIMQSLEAVQIPALRGPRLVALGLLEAHGVPQLYPPIRVETERWLTKQDRLDIRITDANGTVVAIENKVLATPDAQQIARYRAGLKDGPGAYLLVLSTAFDDDVRESLGCEYVGVPELLKVMRPHRGSHFLLGEYFAWLEALNTRREGARRDAHDDSPDRHASALGTAEGQWALMSTLSQNMTGRQYRGVGLNGRPWTEFRFVEQTPTYDAIFYRLDQSAEGCQIQLKQYRDDVFGKIDAGPKMDRLALLRPWWLGACGRHGSGLQLADCGNRGAKASVIGRLLLHENPPTRLNSVLPNLHEAFVRKLRREGWPGYPMTRRHA